MADADKATSRWGLDWRVDLALATALLTRLPVVLDERTAQRPAAAAVWAYPVVGLALGLGAGLVFALSGWLGAPPGVAAALAMGTLALATGAIHEDGLADTADGIGGGATPERRLEIMRDSRIGVFGALTLLIVGLARWSALASLDAVVGLAALVMTAALSRALLPMGMMQLPNARGDGMSAAVGPPPRTSVGVALVVGVGASLLCAPFIGVTALLAVVFAGLAALWVFRLALVKIGGRTGDILGAAQQAAETAALVTISLSL